MIQKVNESLEEIMALHLEEESADEEVTDESNKHCTTVVCYGASGHIFSPKLKK